MGAHYSVTCIYGITYYQFRNAAHVGNRLPSEPKGTFSRGFPLSDGKWFSTYTVIAFSFILFLTILTQLNSLSSTKTCPQAGFCYDFSYIYRNNFPRSISFATAPRRILYIQKYSHSIISTIVIRLPYISENP